MTSNTNPENDFDFVEATSPSVNDAPPTYGSINPPSYDPEYKFENTDPQEKQKQIEKWHEELEAIETDIRSLSTTLNTKIERANELKTNLGINTHPWKDLQQSLQSGIKTIRESSTYQKTNDTLHKWNNKIQDSTAYQKTSAAAKTVSEKTSSAITSIGSSMSKKIGDMRNSQTFKSIEDKVESTYTSVKAKVRGSKSEDNLNPPSENDTEMTSAENPNGPTDEQIPL